MDELDEAVQAQIYDAIFAGKKILAIKHYRDATGSSLMNSKRRVESAIEEIVDRYPERFSRNAHQPSHSKSKKSTSSTPTEDAVLDAIFACKKLDAVKAYKAMSGASLMESKKFVEELTRELREDSPELFGTVNSKDGAGCASVILVLVAIATLVAKLV